MTIKKIAMLSVHTSPLATLGGKEAGGMNVYIKALSETLSDMNIEVDVFTRSSSPDLPRIEEIAENSRLIRIKAGPERPYKANEIYGYMGRFVAGMLRWPAAYDLIYSHYWLSGVVAMSLRDRWQMPFVHMFHTLGHMKNIIAKTDLEREPSQRVKCEAEIMRQANRLIASTTIDQSQMVSHYDAPTDKMAIISPGVDLNRFKAIDKAQAKANLGLPAHLRPIVLVGRIQPLKGFDTLIRALGIIKQTDPELAKTVWVGIIGGSPNNPDSAIERAEFERLYALRDALGVGEMVHFLGGKTHTELVTYYSAAEMVVMPSHYETFGMVALEAMACGTPVLASDVGGLSFSVSEGYTGYRFPVQDAATLADRMLLLLKRPLLAEQLGQQAQAWVERFAWPSISRELLDLFEETVAEYRPPTTFMTSPQVMNQILGKKRVRQPVRAYAGRNRGS